MNLLTDAFAWLTDPAQWTGGESIPIRALEHVAITVAALVIGAVIALPAGLLIGHFHRGSALVGATSGAARALPTLGLLTLFGLALGIGVAAPLIALVILAIPSLLAGAYAGVESIDRTVPSAAAAIGFSPAQVLVRVELPLALPVIVGGLRAATLQVVSTATLAAYMSDIGLGRYLFAGLKTRDYGQMLAGASLVIALTVILDQTLAAAQRRAARRATPEAPARAQHVQREEARS